MPASFLLACSMEISAVSASPSKVLQLLIQNMALRWGYKLYYMTLDTRVISERFYSSPDSNICVKIELCLCILFSS